MATTERAGCLRRAVSFAFFRVAAAAAAKPLMNDDARRYAPATLRNREPLLAVLQRVLPERARVLEVASGTGEHALFFAARLPAMTWQPSDPDATARASIEAWRRTEGTENLRRPVDLDVTGSSLFGDSLDALVCINLLHIAPWAACEGLFRLGGTRLRAEGLIFVYGPFRQPNVRTAFSNEAFDHELKAQDPAWGLRNVDDVVRVAEAQDVFLEENIAMPANNLVLLFRRK